ncbi:MAG: toll/interleukin-1 receptor domain-containing protein [Chloroflexi bacterium]|nr:toll/interleukin-1 receptor domain-containing protein [Chloroflexota bacterium]MBI5705267.1 toll/interleukin-1 receptor domain-containing protein [Chloroflexota bacterium]
MPNDIFISYSRRDSEFVTRLASDLDKQVAGVWFDQSDIQLGEKWHDEILKGIRDCKAFVLVLSPDADKSKYVHEEVNKALELGKTIFPVIYRPAEWSDEFKSLVKDIQTLDLRAGSYVDSFQKLVDGLVAAGAGKASGEIPFLRTPAKVGMNLVLSKVPGWAFVWSLGWLIFWLIVFIALFILVAIQGRAGPEDFLNFLAILFSGGIGGFAGGLIAGLFTMLALRPNAPSIAWKHMSPTIRIWAVSGPLGMIVSGIITIVMLAIGVISVQNASVDCSGLGFSDCLGRTIGAAIGEAIGTLILVAFVFVLLVIITWFLTGMFAGSQVVRHVRRLEPGITKAQSRGVSLGWGCGAIVAAMVMIIALGVISSVLGL